jgi:Orsellinic acid/F9775 biosynthesis cluster protein D
MAQPIPQALAHLIALNVEYSVLICIDRKCQYALEPSAISRHLRDKHKTPIAVRKQVDQYVEAFPFVYDYKTVALPIDGSAPQPIIPIVDGFQCKERGECAFKTTDQSNIRKHANQVHSKKRIADEDICQAVRLQSWFGEKRERYWVVDESQQVVQERQARRAAIQDVGEECDDSEGSSGSGSGSGSDSDSDNNNDNIDPIVQEIENWRADAQERRLQALTDVPVVELDAWHQYTKWNEVLSQSKHNMVRTFQYTRKPDADDKEDEAKLNRVLRAWRRILERALDTLAAADQKDALKWWVSPKNEVASQHPFELPQNAKSVAKYSEHWEGMICYFMRTAPKEDWEDETGTYVCGRSGSGSVCFIVHSIVYSIMCIS